MGGTGGTGGEDGATLKIHRYKYTVWGTDDANAAETHRRDQYTAAPDGAVMT